MRAPAEWIPLFSPSHVADAGLDLAIELASTEVSTTAFRERWSQAVARLALHFLAMRDRSESGAQGVGAVTSEAAGGVSASYATAAGSWSSSDADLAQTPHGVAFVRLRDSACGYPEIVR